jgi:hypothetical protein
VQALTKKGVDKTSLRHSVQQETDPAGNQGAGQRRIKFQRSQSSQSEKRPSGEMDRRRKVSATVGDLKTESVKRWNARTYIGRHLPRAGLPVSYVGCCLGDVVLFYATREPGWVARPGNLARILALTSAGISVRRRSRNLLPLRMNHRHS